MAFRQRQIRDRLVFGNEVLKKLSRDAMTQDEAYEHRMKCLEACMDRLPERSREVVCRFYKNGESMSEIGATLTRTANAIGQMLFRIRKALIQCVSDESGRRFTDAHSGAAVCSPTRYGLLTGRHFLRRPNWIEGILNRCLIDEEQLTVAEYLQANGYHTACFGKWHLGQTWFDKTGTTNRCQLQDGLLQPTKGGPNDHGFDYFFGMNGTAVGSPLSLMENRLVVEIPTVKGPKKGRPMAKSHRPVDVTRRSQLGRHETRRGRADVKQLRRLAGWLNLYRQTRPGWIASSKAAQGNEETGNAP